MKSLCALALGRDEEGRRSARSLEALLLQCVGDSNERIQKKAKAGALR